MNVNTAQVAQAKLEALIEAATAVTETRTAYRGAFARVSKHPDSAAAAQAEDDLGALLEEKIDRLERAIAEASKPAALAAPDDEGDVVGRVIAVLRECDRGWGNNPTRQAHALHAAGLLARPVDREALVALIHNTYAAWLQEEMRRIDAEPPIPRAGSDWRETLADAILREVGR